VLDPQAPTEVPDHPAAVGIRHDLDIPGARQQLLVQRVRDDLSDRVAHLPRLEDLLDVQVEQPHGHDPTFPDGRRRTKRSQRRPQQERPQKGRILLTEDS
jgi:hypothetical protein